MARPRNRDLSALEALRHELQVVRLDGAHFSDTWLRALAEALELDKALMHGLRREAAGHRMGWCFSLRMPLGHGHFSEGMDVVCRDSPGRWGVYNPDRIEIPQRNRALSFEPSCRFRETLRSSPQLAQDLGILDPEQLTRAQEGFRRVHQFFESAQLHRDWQLRMLVCDEGMLLGWVGGFRAEEPTERERRLLSSLAVDLKRRLSLEWLLGSAPLLEAALTATLEQVNCAALVLNSGGDVLWSNTLGRAALDGSGAEMRTALQAAARAGTDLGGLTLTPLRAPGLPPHFLAISSARPNRDDTVGLAQRRYHLTPRQAQVLRALMNGQPTRVIAATIDCSERTVEAHVTAILDKLGVASRAAAVARLWELQ